jgi:NADPH-dependent FMN reductase
MQILAISGSLALLPPIQRSSKPLPPWLQRMSQSMSFAGSVISRTPPHAAVAEFRLQLGKSAGVIFSSPEYAHGVPGVLKNALDWVVASGEPMRNLLRFSVPRRVQAMPRHPLLKHSP